MTDEDAAYCAAAWASGVTQKELAGLFGWKTASGVCTAIWRFVDHYNPVDPDAEWVSWTAYRESRIPGAVRNFVAARNEMGRQGI